MLYLLSGHALKQTAVNVASHQKAHSTSESPPHDLLHDL